MGKAFEFLKFVDFLVTPYDFNVSNKEKSMSVTGNRHLNYNRGMLESTCDFINDCLYCELLH